MKLTLQYSESILRMRLLTSRQMRKLSRINESEHTEKKLVMHLSRN